MGLNSWAETDLLKAESKIPTATFLGKMHFYNMSCRFQHIQSSSYWMYTHREEN